METLFFIAFFLIGAGSMSALSERNKEAFKQDDCKLEKQVCKKYVGKVKWMPAEEYEDATTTTSAELSRPERSDK